MNKTTHNFPGRWDQDSHLIVAALVNLSYPHQDFWVADVKRIQRGEYEITLIVEEQYRSHRFEGTRLDLANAIVGVLGERGWEFNLEGNYVRLVEVSIMAMRAANRLLTKKEVRRILDICDNAGVSLTKCIAPSG
jgi:hypothetical protein